MNIQNRKNLLETAKFISLLEKRYDEAIKILDNFLIKHKKDLDALILKGNILELKGLDLTLELKEVEREACFDEALKCYNIVFANDNQNAYAVIDIGDYWERKNCYHDALK